MGSNTTKPMHEGKVVFGYRKCMNTRDYLVRALLPPPLEEDKPNKTCSIPCPTYNCRYCSHLNKTGSITSSTTGRKYKCKHNVTCRSSNVIYCLTCKVCSKQYVGQTKRKLMRRLYEHLRNIGNKNTEDPVGRHWTLPDHTGPKDVEVHILDFIHAHPETSTSQRLRDTIEKNWIHRLRTCLPSGLNTMD